MNANVCTVTVNASLTLYSAPVAYFCDNVTLIYACIIIIIIITHKQRNRSMQLTNMVAEILISGNSGHVKTTTGR